MMEMFTDTEDNKHQYLHELPQMTASHTNSSNNCNMTLEVKRAAKFPPMHGYSRIRAEVVMQAPDNEAIPSSAEFKLPVFVYGGTEYILVRDLAMLWNFPSSYHVLSKIISKSGVQKQDFLKISDDALNKMLLQEDLITETEANMQLFYLELAFIYLVVRNKEALCGGVDDRETVPETIKLPVLQNAEEDLITVSQVFPQYGAVESLTPLEYGTFLCPNPHTKLQVYKHEGTYRRVFGNSISAQERELLFASNNYTKLAAGEPEKHELANAVSNKKPLGRQKRNVGNVDPNLLDPAENILPGCGLIPEFNVGTLCKVPNYFVTNGQMSAAQQNAMFNPQRAHLSSLKLKFSDSSKMSKLLQQLLYSSDQDAYHSKYYYFKSYRGPGSGNYKDAALVNRINRIRRFTPETTPKSNNITHVPANRVTKTLKDRSARPIKGLVHRFFSDDNVEIVLERQRRFTEDFTNLEMLHNVVLFNLLVNSYREVSSDTWDCFFKFKSTDYEKLYLIQQAEAREKRKNQLLEEQAKAQEESMIQIKPTAELMNLLSPDVTLRFTMPNQHREIMNKLPVELRGEDGDASHALSRPIRYATTYPDKTNPEVLNQIELVKLPNANSLGWDNIKKYRE